MEHPVNISFLDQNTPPLKIVVILDAFLLCNTPYWSFLHNITHILFTQICTLKNHKKLNNSLSNAKLIHCSIEVYSFIMKQIKEIFTFSK